MNSNPALSIRGYYIGYPQAVFPYINAIERLAVFAEHSNAV